MFVAIVLGWFALRATGSLGWLFACLGLGLVAYGGMVATAVVRGTWFSRS
jgi:hypothetical protein